MDTRAASKLVQRRSFHSREVAGADARCEGATRRFDQGVIGLMDLTEFRATYPGLYQQAFDADKAAGEERIGTLFALGDAAGNLPLERLAIENGWSVADAVPRMRE